MFDKQNIIKALDCCKNPFDRICEKCPFEKECCHDGIPDFVVAKAIELLKEQEAQKRKWLQVIADTQLAVSPTGHETAEELAKRTGEWNGLQMAWDILMEGR